MNENDMKREKSENKTIFRNLYTNGNSITGTLARSIYSFISKILFLYFFPSFVNRDKYKWLYSW